MKIFTNKGIWQKIVIIFLFILVFQFVATKPVHAIGANVLLDPIMTLFVSIGDAVMAVVQDVLMQTNRAWGRNINSN